MCHSEEKVTDNQKTAHSQSVDSVQSEDEQQVVFFCDYMKQAPPEDIPAKFASGIISTKEDDSCFEISPKGDEMIFVREGRVYLIKQDSNKNWKVPEAVFDGGETSFSKDGTMIIFNSRTPIPGSKVALNVWYSKKHRGQWQKPAYFNGQMLNQVMHAPSISANGNMYASGITRLRYGNNTYQKTEPLQPPLKGHHPFVSPDESYFIFDKRPPNGGYGADLYITYQKKDGNWTEPIWLNNKINTDKMETNAYVTPDNKYMFFTRGFDIYWVKADFVNDLRKQVLK